jgi:hypothetical protein
LGFFGSAERLQNVLEALQNYTHIMELKLDKYPANDLGIVEEKKG